MSPSESDLRGALHDGEGDDVDVDAVLTTGRLRAAQRRHRLLTGAAAAVLVAGVTTGAVVWGNSGGSNDRSSAKVDSATQRAAGAAAAPAASSSSAVMSLRSAAAASHAGTSASAPSASSASSAPSSQNVPGGNLALPGCPTLMPTTTPPAGTAVTTGALFARPVRAVVICAYSSDARPASGSAVLLDAPARALVASLEHARTTRVPGLCPGVVRADARRLAIIAEGTTGGRLPIVTATLNEPACRSWATNGTAVRYGWSPPATLAPRLRSLTTTPNPAPSLGVPENGSPVRS